MTDDPAPDHTGAREFLVVAHTGRENVLETIEAIARHCAAADVALRVVERVTPFKRAIAAQLAGGR